MPLLIYSSRHVTLNTGFKRFWKRIRCVAELPLCPYKHTVAQRHSGCSPMWRGLQKGTRLSAAVEVKTDPCCEENSWLEFEEQQKDSVSVC